MNKQAEDNMPHEEEGTEQENAGEEQSRDAEDSASSLDPQASENAESELDKLKGQVAEANDKFLRLYSEFDNYKKRVNKERLDLIKSAGADLITALLPVFDDMDRAVKSLDSTTEIEPLKEGVALIHSKFKSTLQQKGLKEMEAVGAPFDTDLHDALTSIPAPSEDLKGKVIEEVQKGYFLNDKVIRHAKVIIGQ